MKNNIKILPLLLLSKVVASTDAHDFEPPLKNDIYTADVMEKAGCIRPRTDQFSKEEAVALYFLKLIRKHEYRVFKTTVHKFLYFANGLSYSIRDIPLLANHQFEAHQYGPVCHAIQQILDTKLTSSDYPDIADHLSEDERAICYYTFTIFKEYTASCLSSFTHEPGTPWSKMREERDFRTQTMNIPQEWDHKYFTNTAVMQRFFINPLQTSSILSTNSSIVLSPLLTNYITKKMMEFKNNLTSENMEGVLENQNTLADMTKIAENYSIEIAFDFSHTFVSANQSQIEGQLASWVFPEGFIRSGELEFFYNPVFRARAAIGSSLKDLSSLYYLGQIFQLFSEDENDLAHVNAQKVNQELEKLSTSIIRSEVPQPSNWKAHYDRALAYFYLDQHPEAVKEIDLALNDDVLPPRYRSDLLKRAFYLTNDPKYIDTALQNGFHDFYLQKATIAETTTDIYSCLEKVIIECESPEAYFKIGRMILRENYQVPMTSPLWSKMQLQHAEVNNNQLGIRLLKKAIEFDVSEALTYYIEDSSTDMQEKLAACSLSGNKLWAAYEKGKLLESQHKLQDAFESYQASGPFIGYIDASRLAPTILGSNELLHQAQQYMKQNLEELVRYSGF